jgi:hypothetical protein
MKRTSKERLIRLFSSMRKARLLARSTLANVPIRFVACGYAEPVAHVSAPPSACSSPSDCDWMRHAGHPAPGEGVVHTEYL